MNENLIILKHNFKIPEIIFNDLLDKSCKIISLDYESHKQLENLDLAHIPFEEYLDDNDFELIDEFTFKINTTWHQNSQIKDILTINGINLGWLLEQELYFFLLTLITNFITLKKIKLKEKQLKKIFVSNDLLELSKITFTDCVIEVLDNQHKIQHFGFDEYAIKYNLGKFPLTMKIPRKYFFIIQRIYEKSFLPFFQKFFTKIKLNSPSILLVDFNPARENSFLYHLEKKGFNVFLLNRRRSAIWNKKSFYEVKNSNAIPIAYEQFLDKHDRKEILKLTVKMNENINSLFSNEDLLSEIFSINNDSFWPYMKNHFKNYCLDRFSEAIREMIGSKKLLKSLKPKVILHFFGVALQEKILIHQANTEKISSIMLQHGAPHIFMPGWAKFNPMSGTLPIFDEKMAVWGEMMKEYALNNGMDENNLIVSGSIRHDPYFENNFRNSGKGIILVALMPYFFKRADDQSISSFDKYEQSLIIICNLLKKISDRKKIMKLHPTDMKFNSVFIEPIIKKIDPTIQIVVDADLTKLIPKAEIVITQGLTTFILDSNIFKKPTVTLMYNHDEFKSKLSHGYSKLFEYTNGNEFENYVFSLLADEKARIENIHAGEKFLTSYLSNQGNSSEYLANNIIKD